ncbi:MAG: DUF6544 family protein, partial [Bacteroidales bacterium]
MKYILSTIMLIHGAIHLMGFAKGFNLANIENLQSEIPKLAALLWLVVFLLFALSGIFYWLNSNIWMLFASLATVISVILIIANWSDAKFGIIPNIVIAIAIVFSFSSCAFSKKIKSETQYILNSVDEYSKEIVSENDIAHLPTPVKSWLNTSGVIGKERIQTVWLTQNFLMKLKPQQESWHNATAQQYFTVDKPAFIWTVDMKMSPIIHIKGRDKFVDGKGEMQMRMNSIINLGKETGHKMDEGTLQRYLGEMVWFPSAVLSPYVTWEEIDSLTAKATMNYQGTTGSGTFYFNQQGDFVKFSALRYKGNDPDAKRYEWVIDVDEYAEFEGVRIPSKCRATWKLEEGDWTWCKLEITEIKYNN